MEHICSYNLFGRITLPGASPSTARLENNSVYLDLSITNHNTRAITPSFTFELRYNKVDAGSLKIPAGALAAHFRGVHTNPFSITVDGDLPVLQIPSQTGAACFTNARFAVGLSPFGTRPHIGARFTITKTNDTTAVPTLDVTFTPKQYTHLVAKLSNIPNTRTQPETPSELVLTDGTTAPGPLSPANHL